MEHNETIPNNVFDELKKLRLTDTPPSYGQAFDMLAESHNAHICLIPFTSYAYRNMTAYTWKVYVFNKERELHDIISEKDEARYTGVLGGSWTTTADEAIIRTVGFILKKHKRNTFFPSLCDESGTVKVPDGVTSVHSFDFPQEKCGKIRKVILPDSVREVGYHTFANLSKLEEVILPDELETIGIGAFMLCGLKTVNIPPKVNTISREAFYQSNIQNITIAEGVEEIGDSAFCNCVNLRSIILPSTTMMIRHNAFRNCFKLTDIRKFGEEPFIDDDSFVNCPGKINEKIYKK